MSYQSDYEYTAKYSKTKYHQSIQPSPREVENIQEIRKLIREQSNLVAKNTGRVRIQSDSSDDIDIEVPVKRFPPLPDIPRSDDPFYRTESKLIKDDLEDQSSFLENSTAINFFNGDDQYFKFTTRKETLYHFATTSTSKINHSQRLPSLENQINHSLQNAMDLDEDLPLSNEPNKLNHRLIYTSPGDRMISPIKRPQAPSPPASAYRKKNNQSSDSDSDNDLIIS